MRQVIIGATRGEINAIRSWYRNRPLGRVYSRTERVEGLRVRVWFLVVGPKKGKDYVARTR